MFEKKKITSNDEKWWSVRLVKNIVYRPSWFRGTTDPTDVIRIHLRCIQCHTKYPCSGPKKDNHMDCLLTLLLVLILLSTSSTWTNQNDILKSGFSFAGGFYQFGYIYWDESVLQWNCKKGYRYMYGWRRTMIAGISLAASLTKKSLLTWHFNQTVAWD